MIFFLIACSSFGKKRKGMEREKKKNIFIDIATLYESAS